MKRLLTFICFLIGLGTTPVVYAQQLDYDQLILLDAEELAETGIKEAYDRLLPSLNKYVCKPAPIQELIDNDAPSYVVLSGGMRYTIYTPTIAEDRSWGNATFALFDIVNRQLVSSSHKFYAFNNENDLGGMFLTDIQYKAAIASIKMKSDWPYIPSQHEPWFGQRH